MASLALSRKMASFDSGSSSEDVDEEVVINGPEPVFKHPLLHAWTLWYYKTEKTKEWSENQQEVLSFSTAEDFWALFHYVQPASKLNNGCDYSVFKKGIRPMWEDPANKDGGRWLMSVDKRFHNTDLDHCWLEMLMCMVGESFTDKTDDVCGAVVNIRNKIDRLALWTRTALDSEGNMKIGQTLKNTLSVKGDIRIEYQAHNDAKSGTAGKCLYLV